VNAKLQPLTWDQLAVITDRWVDQPAILECARLADPLFAAMLGSILLGFIGFVPQSILSDTAYIWVHTEPEAKVHPIAIARLALRYKSSVHARYTTLVGHCFTADSRRWLATLGATFGPNNTFTIEAHNG